MEMPITGIGREMHELVEAISDLATTRVLSTATIGRLRERYPEGRADVNLRAQNRRDPDDDDTEVVESKVALDNPAP